jgi:hypothetical protein
MEEEIMENQHKLIKGYRDLTEGEIQLMNNIKAHGNDLGVLIENLEKEASTDKRWLAIGKTDLQKGIMALVRSIAKPESF